MKRGVGGLVTAMFCAAAMLSVVSAQSVDPYDVYNRHYEAVGGLEKLKAIKSVYMEGEVELVGAGLSGSLIRWSKGLMKQRTEIDFGVVKQTTGDNGQVRWVVDRNAKLQIKRDNQTLQERKLDSLRAEYEHLYRRSPWFELTYQGQEEIEGVTCHIVRTTNSINDDTTWQAFDTSTYYMVRSVEKSPDQTVSTVFSDFREVSGAIRPFEQESTVTPPGMTQHFVATRLEHDIPADDALFEPPSSDVLDFVFQEGHSAEHIPFEFIENHIYLPVKIGDSTRLWVLDSGAGATVVDRAYAEELGMEVEGQMKGQGAANTVDVAFGQMPAFSLPGIQFGSQNVAVIEIGWLFEKMLGFEVVGILGYDFLSRLVTRVDYANETLSFHHPEHFAYQGPGVIIDAPISQDNMFHVPMVVDGKYDGLWNLDLGATGCSFHYPAAQEHGLLERDGITSLSFGAGGRIVNRTVRFDSVQFAGFDVNERLLSFPLERGEGAFASGHLTGNIGNTLLRHFTLYLDYKRERVIVEKGDDFDRDFPSDQSGLQVALNDDGEVAVLNVAESTPAADAGLMTGDVLRAVDGRTVEEIGGLLEVRALFREPAGTEYVLLIDRDGKEFTFWIVLDDLFASL